MKNMFGLFLLAAVISGCAVIDKQADKRLGADCTPAVRVDRAAMFTDLLATHYGEHRVVQLRGDLDLMRQALAAGDGMDAAGDAYKAAFIIFAARVLAEAGVKVALGGYDEAVDRLRRLPHLTHDVNVIEARVRISCAAGAIEP